MPSLRRTASSVVLGALATAALALSLPLGHAETTPSDPTALLARHARSAVSCEAPCTGPAQQTPPSASSVLSSGRVHEVGSSATDNLDTTSPTTTHFRLPR